MKPIATRLLTALLCLAALAAAACGGRGVEPGSDEYRRLVRAFYTGLAALEAGDDARAADQLARAAEIAPNEPAALANWGLLALRQREYDAAAERLGRARELAPESARIESLLGLLESSRGRSAEAIARYRRAVELDPAALKDAYSLAAEIERQGAEGWDAEALGVYRQILEREPGNLVVALDVARLAARVGDDEALRRSAKVASDSFERLSPESRAQLQQVSAVMLGVVPGPVGPRLAVLRNVLVREPAYQSSLAMVKCPPQVVGEPLERFLVLPPPPSTPSPADRALAFSVEPVDASVRGWARAVWLDGDSPPVVAVASPSALALGQATLAAPGELRAVATADLDYDFRTDVVVGGTSGLRIYRQESAGAFADVTAAARLPRDVAGGAVAGVWAADVDSEGDLDLVVAFADRPASLLVNNGDGTFAAGAALDGAPVARDLAWADFDGDGDPDMALVGADGRLAFLSNERGGVFRAAELPAAGTPAAALAAADADRDGSLELAVLGGDGSIALLTWDDAGRPERLAIAGLEPVGGGFAAGEARLVAADLDNNGAVDFVASRPSETRVWLGGEAGAFAPLPAPAALALGDVADVDGDGRLDLLGASPDGIPARARSSGETRYRWQAVRPRAKEATGDQRINSFGIGGEMSVRSGLLYQKYPIDRPYMHFGLGERDGAEIVRIVWPNGTIQAEFELAADQAVLAEQRLKGSCPFLFAWDGERMGFVTDFIWRSPLGLKINAQETAGVVQTEDWVKIGADQLVARDGGYDLRITAELWETHFFDHVSLMAVDHPSGTEVFVDERFAVPPPKLEVRALMPPRPLAGAWDDGGRDVSEVVAARDGRYLDTFAKGRYQGVARDHWVEVALPEDAPSDRPLTLVANGFVYPTDSSINVAIAQGSHEPPRSLSLEVPDGRGGWVVARADLGFPEGKNKTVLLDLDGLFPEGSPRRVRLRTNMEVYWDSIEWAEVAATTPVETRRLAPEAAELRYRGFSRIARASATSPDLPEYGRIETTVQRWRDLAGYYTRFGDVRELLMTVDDRYVIMNAGDELAFRFAALEPPRQGWVRDFVLVGDGWVKDGDLNTAFSATVLPLPSHARPDYSTPPGRLEDDPVYRAHASDWERFHTRYVTPRAFRDALVLRESGR